uniref:Zinc finger protein 830 n=1 Tax=Dermatophagoides pteronyssinus TaxID=6956 RepID=A0A6P6YL59_DERPT|nr:zinc finger protein 830-like [Dermatophagoides pteronyssinus]
MATSSKKLSQQELRQLMREKVQSKKDIRIDSPLARYDDRGQLWCRICNQIINTEFLWSTHLIGKSHKKKIEELKQKSKSTSTKESPSLTSGPLKRSLPVENIDTITSNKIKKSSDNKDDIENNKSVTASNVILDSSLPKDFFDNETKKVEAETNESSQLPKGFFDDPQVEQKVRKIPRDQTLENQFELFRKEIAEESIVSQNLMEEEFEDLEKEKTLTEIDEQIEKWVKVDEIQKKIEKIHEKHESLEMKDNSDNSNNHDDDDDDDDDDDQIDFNDINFWRNKVVFR